VGGTNPALLRAMGYGCCIIARDTIFNREVLGETGMFFDDSARVATLVAEIDGVDAEVTTLRERARDRVAERYSWGGIADAYEGLFSHVTNRVAAHGGT
jgi:glycosyltransferase involved in cell wall biosynthesis